MLHPGRYSKTMRKFFMSYRYEFIAALSGAVVMMLELVGARMVAPYFGTSIYVWTAMIGVILGSLSVGYWYGGKLADKAANDKGLAFIVSMAALLIGLSVITQHDLLAFIAGMHADVRLQAVMAALLLLAPASCLLGVVSPYVVKLKLSSLSQAGRSVGQLYAAGTAGSIIGTFATGYWLISWFGNYTLGLLLVLLLLGVSFIAHRHIWLLGRLVIAAVAILALLAPPGFAKDVIADTDSAYSRYQVKEAVTQDGRKLRWLQADSYGIQSVIQVDKPNVAVAEYIQAFKRAADAYGPFQGMLMIGGGTYTFPGMIAAERPQTHIDVVEIDPKLDQLARDFFAFHDPPDIRLIHQDGRVYLNQNQQKYDMIYIDAFSSLSPPYQLATAEAAQHTARALLSNGLVIANVVARPHADDAYYAATYRTYKQVFDSVKVYRAQSGNADERQNLVFVMGGTAAVARIENAMKIYAKAPIPTRGLLLSDDHAPVDQLIGSDRF